MADEADTGQADSVEVVLTTLSGEKLAALRRAPEEKISAVKQWVRRELGYPERAQQLLPQGGGVVEEERLLGSFPRPLLLSLVLLPFNKTDALFKAAHNGHATAVRSLLLRVAIDYEERRNLLTTNDAVGDTALVIAAKSGHEMTCRALLEFAPDAEVQKDMLAAADIGGYTALLHAADRGHEMACGALLELAPSLDVRAEMLAARSDMDFGRGTALHYAALYGHDMASRVLLELAPNPEVQKEMLLARDDSGATALLIAAEKDNEAVCRQLLQAAQSLEVREELLAAEDDEGQTALKAASGACRLLLASS